ncbi:MAG: TIGR03067 domain-containing protein [Gemmataceae bacterium]|nr:TIGR03067 domain-containing protein [Gemmataceae bacterium]
MLRMMPAVAFVVLLLGAQAAPKDEEKFEGSWTVTAAEKRGKKVDEDELKKMKITIKGSTISIGDGKRDESAEFKLDATKKPKTMDIIPGKEDKPVLGIYDLDGDTLKMCWARPGGERPSKFATDADSNTFLLVLKRAKKE